VIWFGGYFFALFALTRYCAKSTAILCGVPHYLKQFEADCSIEENIIVEQEYPIYVKYIILYF